MAGDRATEIQIGAVMPDGTVYAGISPDTGRAIYTTPGDAERTFRRGNTGAFNWEDAMDYAAQFDGHGHKDWRVPTKGELNVLFSNRAAIGGFNETGSNPTDWYWSSIQASLPTSNGPSVCCFWINTIPARSLQRPMLRFSYRRKCTNSKATSIMSSFLAAR